MTTKNRKPVVLEGMKKKNIGWFDLEWFLFWKKILCLLFKFINIFGFTWDFNFALANEVETVINDEDGTFLDSELVNREIVNNFNNENNDIDNVNSLNMVNNCCVNNFYDSFQIDAM